MMNKKQRIVYCIPSVFNSGGMERILSIKTNYFADVLNHDVTIITTDQKNKSPFFHFSNKIKFVDLGINYCEEPPDPILKFFVRIRNKRKHRKKLQKAVNNLKPDILISMFQHDATIVSKLQVKSIKIIESHFAKFYRKVNSKGLVSKIISVFRDISDNATVKKYDAFVTLTQDDKNDWPSYANIKVIPNPITAEVIEKREKTGNILAVGRVTFQKGFDDLLKAWHKIEDSYPDHRLTIIGAQDDTIYFEYIKKLIQELALKRVELKKPVANIGEEYAKSDFLVMSSKFEGLPLVLIESQAAGLPTISYNCKCGPKEIITHGFNGMLVDQGDINGLAESMKILLGNPDLRDELSRNSLTKAKEYELDRIMEKWTRLFIELKND